MAGRVDVRVEVPWLHEDRRYLAGQWVRLSVPEYRKHRDLGYFVRDFRPFVEPRTGRIYLHALNACGKLVGLSQLPLESLRHYLGEAAPVTTRGRTSPAPEPAGLPPLRDPVPLEQLPSPWAASVVRRDCGCGGRRRRTVLSNNPHDRRI